MNVSRPVFNREKHAEFFTVLKKRVNLYFDQKNITKYGNWKMLVKTIFMLTLFLTPYFFLVTGFIENYWIVFGMWFIMGIGKSGIGLSIMHDANHGVLSKYKTINTMMEATMNFVGGNSSMWKKKHNVLHHTFTNVDGHDDDIDAPGILRFSPHKPLKKIHKYQHIYAWFIYSLLTLMWISYSDFKSVFIFKKEGLIRNKKDFRKEFFQVTAWKLIYFAYLLVIPLIFSSVPFWITLIGFVIMHLVTGFVLSVIFQLAHVMPDCDFPLPNLSGKIDNNWAVHQLATTANFAPKNKIMSWFVGGLNYQVEHHLFTNISHVHYPAISKIVKKTAIEYGIPYYSEDRFFKALKKHASMLKSLGRKETLAVD
ncbi:MAG: acyl-CoA desaturase [Crocinitomicaceae bacterium]|nr:acyl-CoA desaturase [Crocinitomicaceae bacterium]